MKMTEKAQGLVQELTDLFMAPETMIEGMATVCLYGSEDDNRPIDRWSLRNRLLAWAAGTFEARTFNQWKKMNVSVLKGSKAFYILGPNLIDEVKGGVKTGEKVLIGYRVIPEFKVEDTDFADQCPEWKPKDAPPLSAIADCWGLAVRYVPRNVMADAAGYTDCETRITLCTHDERVFFHELMHVADAKANGKRVDDSRPIEEVEAIAEMGAAIIARMFGQQFTDKAYKYVEHFSEDPQALVLKVLPKLEKALKVILAEADALVETGVLAPF